MSFPWLIRDEYTKFDPSASYKDFICYLGRLEQNEDCGAWFFSVPDYYLSVFAHKYRETVDKAEDQSSAGFRKWV